MFGTVEINHHDDFYQEDNESNSSFHLDSETDNEDEINHLDDFYQEDNESNSSFHLDSETDNEDEANLSSDENWMNIDSYNGSLKTRAGLLKEISDLKEMHEREKSALESAVIKGKGEIKDIKRSAFERLEDWMKKYKELEINHNTTVESFNVQTKEINSLRKEISNKDEEINKSGNIILSQTLAQSLEKAKLIDSHSKVVAEKEDKIDKLRIGISNLKAKNETILKENVELKSKQDHYKILNVDLNKQIDKLIQEGKTKEASHEEKLQDLESKVIKLKEEVNTEDEVHKIELLQIESKNVETVKVLNNLLDSKSGQIRLLQSRIATIQNALKIPEKSLLKLISNCNNKLKEHQSKPDTPANIIDEFKSLSDILNTIHDFKTKNLETVKELKTVKQELEDSKITNKILRSDNSYKLNEELRSELKELNQEKKKNDEEQKRELLEIKTENAKTVMELNVNLLKKTTELESEKRKLEEILKKVNTINQLNEELKSQNKMLNEDVERKDEKLKKVDTLKTEKEKIQKELSNEKLECAKLLQIKKDDDERITELQNDLQEKKEEVECQKRKAKSLASIYQLEKENNDSIQLKVGELKEMDEKNKQLTLDLEESTKKIVILETRLEEESVTRLKGKISIKEEKIKYLEKNKEQYWSPRVENLTHIIEMKKEANSNGQIVMASAKDPANQNDYLEVREKMAESDELNNAFQTLLQDKENIICRLEKRTEDCVCGRIVLVQSVEKRPMMDEQLNVEQHKRKRITY